MASNSSSSLKRNRRHPDIGIFVDISFSYGRKVLHGIAKYANLRRQWNLVVDPRRILDHSSNWPELDALICIGQMGHLFHRAREKYEHIIVCSGAGDPKLSPVVASDDQAIGLMAAEHLMNCQLSHFGYYGQGKLATFRPDVERMAGFEKALTVKSYACEFWNQAAEYRVGVVDWVEQPHHPALLQWIMSLPKPIGIFCFDDNWANDLCTVCFKSKIAVPEEVAILGVNNDDLLCELSFPPLSSIDGGLDRIGFSAAQQLDAMLSNELPENEHRFTLIPPLQVIKRQSTEVTAIEDPAILAAIYFIRDHACDPCSVGDILQAVPIGRRLLERRFVSLLGRTPHEEILRIRIETAKRLLMETDLSMATIAARCGYGEIKGFYLAFNNAVSTTPAKFRQRSRATSSDH